MTRKSRRSNLAVIPGKLAVARATSSA